MLVKLLEYSNNELVLIYKIVLDSEHVTFVIIYSLKYLILYELILISKSYTDSSAVSGSSKLRIALNYIYIILYPDV